MTSHDITSVNGDHGAVGMGETQQRLHWLLKQFADTIPGVTQAVLLSRDGLKLLDSGIHPDWADEIAAAFSGIASLAQNVKGPSNKKLPAQQIIIEREDAFFFIQYAGTSDAFKNHPGNTNGMTDTVLGVIARPDAQISTVGYEMGRLVGQFEPYMAIPVRQDV
ncbi:roadblock/LC7 domain-containing protein [Streptomyces sp. bgisy153]|uniref:roadblock/LC7 domain-containing protein n=1 Tax=Streptomyces sp. bgisy153 TaxID=3413793 RepID=UPI003D749FD7